MTKEQDFAGLTQRLPFAESDFYESYRRTFENTELGMIKTAAPLHEKERKSPHTAVPKSQNL